MPPLGTDAAVFLFVFTQDFFSSKAQFSSKSLTVKRQCPGLKQYYVHVQYSTGPATIYSKILTVVIYFISTFSGFRWQFCSFGLFSSVLQLDCIGFEISFVVCI